MSCELWQLSDCLQPFDLLADRLGQRTIKTGIRKPASLAGESEHRAQPAKPPSVHAVLTWRTVAPDDRHDGATLDPISLGSGVALRRKIVVVHGSLNLINNDRKTMIIPGSHKMLADLANAAFCIDAHVTVSVPQPCATKPACRLVHPLSKRGKAEYLIAEPHGGVRGFCIAGVAHADIAPKINPAITVAVISANKNQIARPNQITVFATR